MAETKEHVAMKPPKKTNSVQAPPKQDKTQIANRLVEAVQAAKKTNRSADLVPLTQDYNLLHNRLRSLIAALRTHQAVLAQLDKAQMDVVKEVSDLSEKSPIASHVSGHGETYMGVHETMSKHSKAELKRYQDTIIDYALEWDRVVTTRVEAGQKETHSLNGVLTHYQSKVDSLRKDANKQLDKGKQSPARKTEKLTRNEEKLKAAWEEHERSASTLCDLLQEATESGWKDLYPLVVAMCKFDSEKSADERSILSKLDVVQSHLLSTVEGGTEEVPPPPVESSSEEETETEEMKEENHPMDEVEATSDRSEAESTDKSAAEDGKVVKSEELGSPTAVADYDSEDAGDTAPVMPKLDEV